jgi:hypothetical protein
VRVPLLFSCSHTVPVVDTNPKLLRVQWLGSCHAWIRCKSDVRNCPCGFGWKHSTRCDDLSGGQSACFVQPLCCFHFCRSFTSSLRKAISKLQVQHNACCSFKGEAFPFLASASKRPVDVDFPWKVISEICCNQNCRGVGAFLTPESFVRSTIFQSSATEVVISLKDVFGPSLEGSVATGLPLIWDTDVNVVSIYSSRKVAGKSGHASNSSIISISGETADELISNAGALKVVQVRNLCHRFGLSWLLPFD